MSWEQLEESVKVESCFILPSLDGAKKTSLSLTLFLCLSQKFIFIYLSLYVCVSNLSFFVFPR